MFEWSKSKESRWLNNAKLQGAHLSNIDLSEADLRGAEGLQGINLT